MLNSAAKINCSNPNCQTPNSLERKVCVQCQTPLLKRYLWMMGEKITAYQPGELIAERYLVVQPQIVLDTKPNLLPAMPEVVPSHISTYLKLAPYRLHIPQVYGYIAPSHKQSELWLLEYGMVSESTSKDLKSGQLLPTLNQAWQSTGALRQLNWLWQIAELWQPLVSYGVASTLLQPSLLQVKGAIVHLRELTSDGSLEPSLQDLGRLWSSLTTGSITATTKFLGQLCQELEQKQLTEPEQLVNRLNQAIDKCASGQNHTYQVYSATDTGPTRDHNEDACYPTAGKTINFSPDKKVLSIVCDGIGGHEGGEIASQLAISAVNEQVKELTLDSTNPVRTTIALENAACSANDLISQRNDSEKRQERQRMGTTLVMSLAQKHEIYITHVGDSRVYLVTKTGCHLITFDDDVASREVRLGYSLYRNALQSPVSGSLVQALGMGSSASLRPTVQRLVLDEDCVFVLCTDGLSDNDRMEQYWEQVVLPLLSGQGNLEQIGQRLIEVANQKNGHDNVTVSLVYCKVEPKDSLPKSNPATSQVRRHHSSSATSAPTATQIPPQPTIVLPKSAHPPKRSNLFLLMLLFLLGVTSTVGIWYWQDEGIKAEIDQQITTWFSYLVKLKAIPSKLESPSVVTPAASPVNDSPSVTPAANTNQKSNTTLDSEAIQEPATGAPNSQTDAKNNNSTPINPDLVSPTQ